MDRPSARFFWHALDQGGNVGAPSLVLLPDSFPRDRFNPWRLPSELLRPKGDVVSGGKCDDVDLYLFVRLRT